MCIITRRDIIAVYIGLIPEKRYINEPKEDLKQLTDKDGLDRVYDGNTDISTIDSTINIAGTRLGRGSVWYDDIVKVPTLWNAVPITNQYKSFMFGLKALPDIGYLARKPYTAVRYVSTALKVVPLLALEYTEAATAIDGSLRTVSMGLNAAPHIANAASSIAPYLLVPLVI